MRAIGVPVSPRAEDDDVVDRPGAVREDVAPLARGLGRPDHDHAVAGLDRLVAARDDHAGRPWMMLATFESGGISASRSGWPTVSSDGRARPARRTRRSSTWPSAKTSVCCAAGHADDAARSRSRSRARRRPRSRRRAGARARPPGTRRSACARSSRAGESARQDAGDDVGLVAGRAGDDEVGVRDPAPGGAPARPVALDRQDVVPVRGARAAGRVDHGDRALPSASTIVAPTCPRR